MSNQSFKSLGHTLSVHFEKYANNMRLAVQLFDETGDPCTTLSCNLPGENLEEGEFFVKTWSENEEISRDALNSGLFVDTGKRSSCSLGAPVWRVASNTDTPTEEDETLMRVFDNGYFTDTIVDGDVASNFAVTVIAGPVRALMQAPKTDEDQLGYQSMPLNREQAYFVHDRLGKMLAFEDPELRQAKQLLALALQALNTKPRFKVSNTDSYAIAAEIDRFLAEPAVDMKAAA